jgi:hypothetical protein
MIEYAVKGTMKLKETFQMTSRKQEDVKACAACAYESCSLFFCR